MNNNPVAIMSFPVDNFRVEIVKAEQFNSITAIVTINNEPIPTSGMTTEEKVDFDPLHCVINKPDQFIFNLDLKLEGNKTNDDALNIIGTFTGNGTFEFMGETQILIEVSGNVSGKLEKQ